VKIEPKRLKELERAEAKLNALEAGGVDNWDNYDDSLEEYRAVNELEDVRLHAELYGGPLERIRVLEEQLLELRRASSLLGYVDGRVV